MNLKTDTTSCCFMNNLLLMDNWLLAGTKVCCYACGTEFSRTELIEMSCVEDVWRHHAWKSPHCLLVCREKGDTFVHRVFQERGPYRQPERQPVLEVLSTI